MAFSNALKDALSQIRRNVDMNKSRIQDLDRIVFNEVNVPELGSFEIKAETLAKSISQVRSKTFQ